MDVSLIGAQISKYRKEQGWTQEELGRAVGVSTQAVSRWECGGAPDVTLLPAIADALHVTIDALFGRESGETVDPEKTYLRYLCSLNKEQRMQELVRLLWHSTTILGPGNFVPIDGFVDHCRCPVESVKGDKEVIVGVQVINDAGTLLGVCAKDMSFMSVFPEPEEGYAPYFDSCDHYRRLFSALAEPGALELLLDLLAQKQRFLVPAAEAKRLGVPEERAAELMAALEKGCVLQARELELADGVVDAYELSMSRPVVPLLYLARLVGQPGESYHLLLHERNRPWLHRPEREETK